LLDCSGNIGYIYNMTSKRCPRCDSIYPSWQPIHFTCFLARLSIFGLFIFGLFIIAALITVLRNLPTASVTLQASMTPLSTISITNTKMPTSTLKPTKTKAPVITSTLTPKPTTILLQAKIYTVGNEHVTIESTQAIEGDYRAIVDGMDYKCVKIKNYPNRLYCYGNKMESGRKVQIKIYPVDSDDIVFEGTFRAP
jgi:hypothetical protein